MGSTEDGGWGRTGGSNKRDGRRRLPSGLAEDSGVLDVWFERSKSNDRPQR